MADQDRPTSDRLRHEIDRGGTGDKVPFMDPAAAPLGTDDEAAGTPPTREQMEMARRDEARIAPTTTQNDPARVRTVGELAGNQTRRGLGPIMALAAVVVLIALVALAL